jgi:transcriptional regulator with XRE-family HTH domain
MVPNYLCDNIKILMMKKNVSTSQLARDTQLPLTSIKKIRNGTNLNPTIATLLPIAQYFEISIEDLFTENKENKNTLTPNQIPIISWEESLLWPHVSTKKYATIPCEAQLNETAFVLRVESDGWGIFSNGNLLLIDTSLNPSHNDYAIVHKKGMLRPTLKKILIEDEKIFLQSISISNNFDIRTSEHRIIGIAVEYRQVLKQKPISILK